jgi:hypothetical protein
MDKVEKFKAFTASTPIDSAADIDLINKYALKELTPEDVFCFPIILADNEVDRDIEKFPKASLDELAKLLVGKTGIFDHRWSAEKQVARLYRCEVVEQQGKNSVGEQKLALRGSAYMLKIPENEPLITAIEGGIVKEVSVGFHPTQVACSVCGKKFKYSWDIGKYICENGHVKGAKVDDQLVHGNIMGITDAYEFSFVAVPSQRCAGVTKSVKDLSDAVELMKSGDLATIKPEDLSAIIKRSQMALSDNDEREERAKILAENEKFLKGVNKNDII